ncbi:MAG TPA: glycoside hydrolase family 3 N-terminal domain-containing protein [Thermoleophilaceae bacterium]|nr:glycoside hydrolase family 3 N-terminal domain-containing protein [Thermoleophilaceae bacterium]
MRRLALALALCGALPAHASARVEGSGSASGRLTPAAVAAGLTDAQLAGQRVLFAYAGRRAPAALVRRIRRGEAAGVIIFSRNVGTAAALRREMRRLQRIPRPPGLDVPLIVAVDQEGGPVRRIPGGPRRSAAEIGRTGDTARARAAGLEAGRLLRRSGANVDLAPVLDVARPGSAIERERRAFGRSPVGVARMGVAFAGGLRAAGVAATAKHYPGFGAAPANTDFAKVRLRLSRREIRRVDEVPFRAAIRDRIGLVMLSTAVYPALDRRPAALSLRIATTRLRADLGFRGVSVTDALGTPALEGHGDLGERGVRAALAGVDLLLYGGGYPAGARAARSVTAAHRSRRLSPARSRVSVARILRLRASLGRRG